jgi:hypothetical protein
LRIFLGFSDTGVNSGTAVMARRTGRRDRGVRGIPGVVADRGAGATRDGRRPERRRCRSLEATGRAGVLMAAVASSSRARSRRGPARWADQAGGRVCGACTWCRVVLLRAVLGSVRMLKVADDDLCTARSL